MKPSESLIFKKDYQVFVLLLAAQIALLWAIYRGFTDPFAILIIMGVAGIVAFVMTVNFEIASYLFIISFMFDQDLTASMRIRVADLIAALLVLNFFLKTVVTREIRITKTPLDSLILMFLGVLGISLINAKSLAFGTINYLRHIELFLVMYALCHCLSVDMFKRLLYLFLVIVSTNAFLSNIIFISAGGGFRSFGAAGNEFTDMVVPASFIAYAFSFFETNRKKKVILSLMVLNLVFALFATGTRGAMFSWAIGFALTNLALLFHGGLSKRRIITLGIVIPVLLGFLALQFGYTTSHGVMSPYKGYVDTVDFRFALWYLALKSFLAHPILGIGLNQFMHIEEVFPSIKFSVIYPYIKGLDAHSVVLNFAANTGILGLTLLFFLFFKILKLGWRTYERHKWTSLAPLTLSLTLVLTYIVYSSFYAGSWFWSLNGFEFMFFLAMMLRIRKDLNPNNAIRTLK